MNKKKFFIILFCVCFAGLMVLNTASATATFIVDIDGKTYSFDKALEKGYTFKIDYDKSYNVTDLYFETGYLNYEPVKYPYHIELKCYKYDPDHPFQPEVYYKNIVLKHMDFKPHTIN